MEKTINPNGCIIRLEREEDYGKVEMLVREAFWNVYRPAARNIIFYTN